MNELSKKIEDVFPHESLFKNASIYSIFSGYNLPSFIKDWIIKKFSSEKGELDTDEVNKFLKTYIITKNSKLRGKLLNPHTEHTFLARIIIEPDIKEDKYKFSIPDTDIRSNEAEIPKHIVNKHSKYLMGGETWGIIKLIYVPPEGKKKNGHIEMIEFKPFQPYDVNLDYFKDGRKSFELEEWIDLLISSMEYNPTAFESLQQKLIFLRRLLPFVEANLNIIELAPKGTGKSYVYSNLSKNCWLVSGGKVTRAQLFYNVASKQSGIITKYDLVVFDEIETISFGEESELQGALKNYLESGAFTVADYRGQGTAGLVLLGNIPLSNYRRPINEKYFDNLPEFFKSSALLDRFHGFIEGWLLPRIQENFKLNGYALNVEYFSEILHKLRLATEFPDIMNELIDVPKNADTRDTKAIKRICCAYFKLLFPHVRDVSDVDKDLFENYCLKPAKEMRKIVKEQISLIDSEFKPDIPDIKMRE